MQLPAIEENIKLAAEAIKQGKLVAFPTETVYGLGADALNPLAVEKIFLAKGRPSNNPLIVHIPDPEWISRVANVSLSLQPRLNKLLPLWPGPLSVILPAAKGMPKNTTAGRDTVAIRVPGHPVALKLIIAAGTPIAAPSANKHKYVSPTTAEHVVKSLGTKVDFVLDGGPTSIGIESTVISLSENSWRLLRFGAVTQESIAAILGESPSSDSVNQPTDVLPNAEVGESYISPGMMTAHYSPRTLILPITNYSADKFQNKKVGRIIFSPEPVTESTFAAIRILSQNSNLNEVARNLYAAMQELDEMGLDAIIVDVCPTTGIGAAIMDRIGRACAPFVGI